MQFGMGDLYVAIIGHFGLRASRFGRRDRDAARTSAVAGAQSYTPISQFYAYCLASLR